MSESAIVAGDSSVYYGSGYWNEIPAVYHELNRRATGDPDKGWMQHLREYHGRPFSRLLSLNCGNGWVERGLLAHGVAERGVGTDYAEDLLVAARAEAAAAGADLEWMRSMAGSSPEEGAGMGGGCMGRKSYCGSSVM